MLDTGGQDAEAAPPVYGWSTLFSIWSIAQKAAVCGLG